MTLSSVANKGSGWACQPRGAAAMYLLMSLFHLSPWLKLASGRPRPRT
jgi:hypothetical protein